MSLPPPWWGRAGVGGSKGGGESVPPPPFRHLPHQWGGEGLEEPRDLADGHRAQLDQGLAADFDGPCPGVEARTLALGARHTAHERLKLRACVPAGGTA